jgi:purine-nucleoside phosphorylase
MSDYDRAVESADWLRSRLDGVPDLALVLGSGLGGLTAELAEPTTIPYEDIPHWPASRVIGHAGQLVAGVTAGRRVLALSGRVHFYEGHDLGRVTYPVRVLGVLGVKMLILTNAAGGINTRFAKGGLMIIDDHINLLGGNPLIGPNDERFGPRFPDMTEVYSARLRQLAVDAAAARDIPVERGVYVGLQGPSYETPAEIRYLRTIGADAVGMSTVAEAIVARHMGIEVLGLSCITNMAAGVEAGVLDHLEVMETASRVRDQFVALIEGVVARL